MKQLHLLTRANSRDLDQSMRVRWGERRVLSASSMSLRMIQHVKVRLASFVNGGDLMLPDGAVRLNVHLDRCEQGDLSKLPLWTTIFALCIYPPCGTRLMTCPDAIPAFFSNCSVLMNANSQAREDFDL